GAPATRRRGRAARTASVGAGWAARTQRRYARWFSCLGVVESRARPARRPVAVAWGLEGGFGAAVVGPGVALGGLLAPWGLLLAVSALLAVAVALGLLLAVAAVVAGGLLGACDGAGEAGGDVLGLDLVDGPLDAFLVLVAALLESADDDDGGSAGEGFGDVLGELAPCATAHEEGVSVAPLDRKSTRLNSSHVKI